MRDGNREPRRFYCRPDFEPEPGPVLAAIIRSLRHGDVLIVPDVTHLAFTFRDLKDVLVRLGERGALLHPQHVSGSSDEPLAVRYKRDLKRAAVRRAKLRGAYQNCKGAARRIDHDTVRALKSAGHSPDAIAAQLGIARSSVYYVISKAA